MARTPRRPVSVASRVAVALWLVLAALAFQTVPRAAASTLVVTNTNDSGPGSLRQAIIDANPDDTINFDPSLNGGTITLQNDGGFSSHEMSITKALSIIGPGSNLLTINGNSAQRIFSIRAQGTAQSVNISGLKLTGGYAKACAGSCTIDGGAIDISGGNVWLSNLVITGNQAQGDVGAIRIAPEVSGDVPPFNVLNTDVFLSDSIVSDNTASAIGGVGIYGGTVRIERSTISGNTATTSTGGMYISNDSGATGTVTVRNSTVSGNRANNSGGGIGINDSGADSLVTNIQFSTITNNVADADNNNSGFGGGISLFSYTDGMQVNVRDSLIIGNQAPFNRGADCSGGPPLTSQGHNIWGMVLNCPTDGMGDLTLAALGVGASAVLNPTLALNAPGTTPTHALVQGGPAVSAAEGGGGCLATDQRGIARPQGAGCDIGAYEYGPEYAVTLTTSGPGTASISPAGPYSANQQVTMLATWNDQAAIFAGWIVDGRLVGWLNPLVLPIQGQNHTVNATFVPRKFFPDVPSGREDYIAITELASRGAILGYGNGKYGPDDTVQRAQMAALVARATQAGPGTPTNGTLTPPTCIVAGSWDCEDWGNDFQDRNGLDANLWRNVGALQHYQVAFGYDGAGCAARGAASPCFAPNEQVTYAQTISFVTRAMKAKGLWADQPNEVIPYAGVPGPHLADFKTFHHYTQANGGIPAPPADWNAGATRGWFAQTLWAALNSYYATNHLP